jgi:hypothetical protein
MNPPIGKTQPSVSVISNPSKFSNGIGSSHVTLSHSAAPLLKAGDIFNYLVTRVHVPLA